MQRILEKQLLEWKESKRRKPLILRGARQVGKTWLVENVFAKGFESCVKIDLEKKKNLHIYFEGDLDPATIVNYLELSTEAIIPGKTLLFLMKSRPVPWRLCH